MRAALIGILFGLAGFSQMVIQPERIPKEFRNMAPFPDEKPLKCEVVPIQPRVDFGFRFQAGYGIRMQLNQYTGSFHTWAVLTRVTPENGPKPVYLLNVMRLPKIPETKATAEVGGAFLLGEGKYKVELLLVDDRGRACRKQWRVEAKRSRSEKNMTIRMPEGTVDWLGARRKLDRQRPPPKPYRMTLLLHAAPMLSRSTRIRAYDRAMLMGSLAPLLDLLAPERVRLVMFNLDQQKTLLTKAEFKPEDIDEVGQVLNRLELNTVDYSVLQNRGGHMNLLAGLVNGELESKDRSDAVVFLGAGSHYFDKFPESALAERSGGDPLFFFVRYSPYYLRGAEFPEAIQNTVRSLKGKTTIVHTPGEFATALRQIEERLEERSNNKSTVQ